MRRVGMWVAISLLAFLGGCSTTIPAPGYVASTDNLLALREYRGAAVSVGAFTVAPGAIGDMMCRGAGAIVVPGGAGFEGYIRQALAQELQAAGLWSQSAGNALSGRLEKLGFSSFAGTWQIELSIQASNGQSLRVSETYKFGFTYYGEQACRDAAVSLVPALQALFGKAIRSPEFRKLLV